MGDPPDPSFVTVPTPAPCKERKGARHPRFRLGLSYLRLQWRRRSRPGSGEQVAGPSDEGSSGG